MTLPRPTEGANFLEIAENVIQTTNRIIEAAGQPHLAAGSHIDYLTDKPMR
jgi:hypothetical protein